MSWYYGTFSCGHDGRVNVTGPEKNRQWIVDRKFEGLCPECYEKHLEEERMKANEEAAEKAKEMELPELQGTDKQVAWANTLRQNMIDKINEGIKLHEDINKPKIVENYRIALDYMINNKTTAKYYIDNRGESILDLSKQLYKENKEDAEKVVKEVAERDVRSESTVKPEDAKTEMVAEIIVKKEEVKVVFAEKNDDFRNIVKSVGYKWDGIWCKKITELTGSAEDRAAELGNKLLNAGFPICIIDEDTRNNAINGVYEEQCNRWVMTRTNGQYKGRFVIKWEGQDDKLYRISRRLPGSKWDNGTIVRIEYYKEVEEFAELYGFKFTKGTLKAIEEYVAAKENIEVVSPAKVEKEELKDGLKEILESSTEVLDDLLEDD